MVKSSIDMSDRIFSILRREFKKSNLHLPKKKKNLERLLREEKPNIKTQSGNHYFKIEELKKLEKIVPIIYHSKINLPIVLLAKDDGFKISGNLYERFLVFKILKKKDNFFEIGLEKVEDFVPKHLLVDLKKDFSSIFVVGYMF